MSGTSTLRFGPAARFELQPEERRLLVDGQPVALGARALDLLNVLLARPDHLRTKSELLDLAWPGLVVEEANLQVQISTLRKVLGQDVITTVPGRGYRFTAEVHGAHTPAANAPIAPIAPMGLPVAVLPRLFGRSHDEAAVRDALQVDRCVTLVGPAGVGKTSLARAIAAPMRHAWVDLAVLTDATQLPGAVARALNLPLADGDALPQLQLQLALSDAPLCLVLDNAEHLVDDVAQLASLLLAGAPPLRVLVTSQLPLQLSGERVRRLEPLALDDAGAAGDWGDGALALLVQRISAADRRVQLDGSSHALLRAICSRLDGLPLALEMAAARVPLLGVRGVHDELAQRFALLTKGYRDSAARHRTLHNALEWSYRLLNADEQHLFRTLGVFADGFTIDLCVAVAGAAGAAGAAEARWDTIDRLAALVDRSLVTVSTDEPPRYRLLETMRAYALEQLQLLGETDAARARHAAALLALLKDHGAAAIAASPRELGNAAEAVVWAAEHDLELAAGLSAHASKRATFTPWRNETSMWMDQIEAGMRGPAGTALSPPLQALYWTSHARGLVMRVHRRAVDVAAHAVSVCRALGLESDEHWALIALVRATKKVGPELDSARAQMQALGAAHPEWPLRVKLAEVGALAHAAHIAHDVPALLAARDRELVLARQLGEPQLIDVVEINKIQAMVAHGLAEEALPASRAMVERLTGSASANLPWVWNGQLEALMLTGRLAEARQRLPQALADCRASGELWPIKKPMVLMLWREGRVVEAARLLGHTRKVAEDRGVARAEMSQDFIHIEHEIEATLGSDRFQRLEAEGRAFSEDDAATAVLVPPSPGSPSA